jgi:hypothetical protein
MDFKKQKEKIRKNGSEKWKMMSNYTDLYNNGRKLDLQVKVGSAVTKGKLTELVMDVKPSTKFNKVVLKKSRVDNFTNPDFVVSREVQVIRDYSANVT